MKHLLLIFTCWRFIPVQKAGAQQSGQYSDTAVYRIYLEQVLSLYASRGLSTEERELVMAPLMAQVSEIFSDEKLAAQLGKLYPSGRGIGIIFYFFQNDTLRRMFLEPGLIKEKSYIPVKKEELLQLSADFNHLLGLYSIAEKRMPVKRGAIINPPPASKGLTYGGLIKKATALLLPESFSSSYSHLIIVPALNIGTLPFHLLEPYGDTSTLIEKCSFSVAPGLFDLFGGREKMLRTFYKWEGAIEKPFDENSIFNGLDSAYFTLENPVFVSNPAYPTDTDFFFPDLPGAKKEISNAIPFAKKYKLFEGTAAVKDSVLKYLGGADVAYFATHGIADAAEPLKKSFLVLSGSDPFLTAQNIQDVRTQYKQFPELVILSACQTGLGKSMEAGVTGLARSFMLAGANHVIMSLWSVDDAATAYLMNRFLFHLQKPSRFMPAEPLRQAMLDTKKKFPKPSQWASFSLFGIDY
ncbi:MAG: CHAT domain-containing protein [Bacteroidota bacterium]